MFINQTKKNLKQFLSGTLLFACLMMFFVADLYQKESVIMEIDNQRISEEIKKNIGIKVSFHEYLTIKEFNRELK